eukprot:6136318-Alexandrium_andersonii.AAC.1
MPVHEMWEAALSGLEGRACSLACSRAVGGSGCRAEEDGGSRTRGAIGRRGARSRERERERAGPAEFLGFGSWQCWA